MASTDSSSYSITTKLEEHLRNVRYVMCTKFEVGFIGKSWRDMENCVWSSNTVCLFPQEPTVEN